MQGQSQRLLGPLALARKALSFLPDAPLFSPLQPLAAAVYRSQDTASSSFTPGFIAYGSVFRKMDPNKPHRVRKHARITECRRLLCLLLLLSFTRHASRAFGLTTPASPSR
jgi:hypothetical protein